MVPNAQDEVEHERNRHFTLEFYSPERLEELEDKICSESTEPSWNDSLLPMLDTDSIYAYGQVDEPPRFPEGVDSLRSFLRNNVDYAAIYGKIGACFKGRVTVSFVVEKDGSISNVEITRGLHPIVDAEAVRVVKAIPKWIPAKNKGRVVRCYRLLPVIF